MLREMNPDGFEHWIVLCPERELKLCEVFYFGNSVGLFWKKRDELYMPATLKKDESGLIDFSDDWAQACQILLKYNDLKSLGKQRTFRSLDGMIKPVTLLELRKFLRFRYDFSELESATYKNFLESEGHIDEPIVVKKHTPKPVDKFFSLFPMLFWGAVFAGLILFLFRRH